MNNIETLPLSADTVRSRRRRQLGIEAARTIRDTERLFDQALAGQLALGQLLLNGRIESGFAAAVGQGVLVDLAQAFRHAVECRAAVVAVHNGLADLAEDHNVNWRLEGPFDEKPGERPPTTGTIAA